MAFVRDSGVEWSLVAAHQRGRGPAASDVKAVINAAARHGWFREPTYVTDLCRLDGEPVTERPLLLIPEEYGPARVGATAR